MVKFAWSWADYEREKRKEERRAAKLASGAQDTVEPQDGGVAVPVEASEADGPEAIAADSAASAGGAVIEDEEDAITIESQLQHCDACGKRRMQRCDFGGCPLL